MKPPLLDDVAGATLDGTAVDWNSVDSGMDQSDQPVIEQLKTLAALRLVARRGEPLTGTPKGVPHDATATHWGHLRVLERIGHGAFGEVFRAWDTRLDREVALKLLPEELPNGRPEGRPLPASSIIEEGRLLARVRHPNVVTIYGAERIDGRVGLWMERVRGRTLEQALGEGTAFTAKEVTRIGVELCSAVAAVHAAGLLHRDIKAQNVMLASDDDRLVLMDFGTGRERDEADANVSGTPLYLAPEVLAGGAATAQSDVYSVGVLLYHLLTGSYPIHASTLAELRHQLLVRHVIRARSGHDERVDVARFPGAQLQLVAPVSPRQRVDGLRLAGIRDIRHDDRRAREWRAIFVRYDAEEARGRRRDVRCCRVRDWRRR